jgi:hypothetical protein
MSDWQDSYRKTYNDKHIFRVYEVGEYVLLHRPVIPYGESRVLHHHWYGPYKILRKLGTTVYEIKHVYRNTPAVKVNAARIKHFHGLITSLTAQQINSFSIKAILAERYNGEHGYEYLVEWNGYPKAQDTWIPEAEVPPGMLRTYQYDHSWEMLRRQGQPVNDLRWGDVIVEPTIQRQ